MVVVPSVQRERGERENSQFRCRIAKKRCGTDFIGEVVCLIGGIGHVSGVKKSEREWLCKLVCRQLFPFAFYGAIRCAPIIHRNHITDNEKRSFSQSLLGDFSRRKVAVPSVIVN